MVSLAFEFVLFLVFTSHGLTVMYLNLLPPPSPIFSEVNLALKVSLPGLRADQNKQQARLLQQRKGSDGNKLGLSWPLSASELCDACAAELDHSIMRTIDDIHASFAETSAKNSGHPSKIADDTSQDVMVKTATGGWLAARKSQHRELYVVLADHLSALQASEALEALCQEFFSSVLC